jgi:hypothetical protein
MQRAGFQQQQTSLAQPAPIEKQYFNQQNEINLYNTLLLDFQQRQGGLTEKQQSRLARALEHYMREVWDVNGPMPLPQLNREALQSTANDFQSYLRRDAGGMPMATSQMIVTDPANQNRAESAQQRLQLQQGLPVQPRPTFESNLLMDTGNRFEQLQQERNGGAKPVKSSVPDFQISLSASADEPSALSLFESAKKAREGEAARVKAIEGKSETDASPLVRFMTPPSILNDPNTNPTLAQPIAALAPPVRGSLPQDFLIKQDDVITYKEIEQNLIVYSADRDWLTTSNENRYQFSINFDRGNSKQGFYTTPTSTKKFKNITRIELVKVILPTEGLETLTTCTSGTTYSNTAKLNVLNYPYILLRVPELDTNNYGTDNNLDNSFAMLQYDANWYTDSTNLEDGFLAMIPKFMKCQKVYQPTPLATLTKLTIELQSPDGQLLSSVSDTLSIQNLYISGAGGGGNNAPAPPAGIVSTNYKAAQTPTTGVTECGDYIFIQTSTYFSKWQFAEGNRIEIAGLDPAQVPGGSTAAAQQLVLYLQTPGGLPIVAIAYTGGADGANDVGYANVIIVRAPHANPTTGSVAVQPFGGTATTMNTLATAMNAVAVTATTYTSGKLINLTHQTSLVFRIITREMDPTARVRPDNL